MSDDTGPQLTPYLLYADVPRALEFLGKAFGFTPFGHVMKDKSGKVSHASVKLDRCHVMLGCPGADYKCIGRING